MPSASRRPSPSEVSPWCPPQVARSASSTARTRRLHPPRGFLRPRSSRWWSTPIIRSRTTPAMRKAPRKTRGGWVGSCSAGPASYRYIPERYARAPQTRTCRPTQMSSPAGSSIAGRSPHF
uniref:Uncharacterized protein n=1 Tax=Zea mays TaxID=4577 RepID=A0A804QUW3_MAIZE